MPKIQLVGSIHGNEDAERQFNDMEKYLLKHYPQAVIFNPLKRGFKQILGESAQAYDCRCLTDLMKVMRYQCHMKKYMRMQYEQKKKQR